MLRMCSCWQKEAVFIFIFLTVGFLRNVNSAGECDFIGDMTPEEDLGGTIDVEKGGSACGVRAVWIH